MDIDLEPSAFLSVRVPLSTRSRIKAAAAARGEKLQDLVGRLIDDYLRDAERRPPDLGTVMRVLRTQEADLRRDGVAALYVFGSVARGQARADSDVDLAMEFAPDAPASLLDIARLQDKLADGLGYRVDLGELSALQPEIARAAAADMVRVY